MDEAAGSEGYVAERLDHLGIVAGVCREIGLAEWLDAQDEQSHERVGVGTATLAMILNGLEDRLALFCVSDIHRNVSRPAHHNRGAELCQ